MMMKVILAMLMLVVGTAGVECLAQPDPVGTGKFCGFATTCSYGNYCDRTGVCQVVKAAGESCMDSDECGYGTQCQGPDNSKQCVAYANPGDACDADPDTVIPSCGPALSCLNDTCADAYVGDSCKSTADCHGLLLCVDGFCSPLADGADCNSDRECHPNSYCGPNAVCRSRKTLGICNFPSDCAYGYNCLAYSSGDIEQCVEKNSRDVEEYCERDSDCASKRCYNNKCSKKGVSVCTSDGQCSEGQACKCGGMTLEDGYGTCINNPCSSSWNKLEKCLDENCKTSFASYSSFSYSGSCVSLNCAKERETYMECSPASKVAVSFFTLALFTFFASYLGKKI